MYVDSWSAAFTWYKYEMSGVISPVDLSGTKKRQHRTCLAAVFWHKKKNGRTCCNAHVVVIRHMLLGGAGDRVVVLRQRDCLLQGICVWAAGLMTCRHLSDATDMQMMLETLLCS